jgi:molybdopterin-containing oxidoreductase family iron-sulfur binding subunit
MMRYGMVIDLLRCMGCGACSVACRAEHGTPSGISHTKVKILEIGEYPNARMKFLPMPCMHCKEPPCLEVCPTDATSKRDDGLVLIDKDECIGCGSCIVACPYGSRELLVEKKSHYEGHNPTPYEMIKGNNYREGTAVKCNFCLQRLEQGRLPACVEACPAQSRTFGDVEDPESEISKILEKDEAISVGDDPNTEPSVYYIKG